MTDESSVMGQPYEIVSVSSRWHSPISVALDDKIAAAPKGQKTARIGIGRMSAYGRKQTFDEREQVASREK